jgi:hypothetical protein
MPRGVEARVLGFAVDRAERELHEAAGDDVAMRFDNCPSAWGKRGRLTIWDRPASLPS